ncbi:23S rRNA (cytosine1962-C5)-methyltransferase [Silvibacterium bohemicum]|uniref:23S rRNA (Cytosine1962-C5)-methyltransferase n=1 Tax=Silvibacterium bohemicum TaxID=1577686 RepID=A0A841K600_9BACT|nr:class I SAM-dependent rRNA methyltransferase [Silvibacterium bohemicum]MBB6147379.1 23S rRNA (cytosine1962-C5)-methyltransferase [Silvibacterium bohemicum]
MKLDESKQRRKAGISAAKATGAQTRVPAESENGAVVIARRAADRLRAGHVWVYRSDIVAIPSFETEGEESSTASAPHLLPVSDQRGDLLGTALYSPFSEIALRLVTTEPLAGQAAWLDLLATRLRAAVARRTNILAGEETNACRLVFSEADALPGLVVDKYGELVILQLLSKALDDEAVRIVVTQILRETLRPATIVERPDPRIRELEQIDPEAGRFPLFAANSEEPLLQTAFKLNGLNFHYDASSGQKTGAFLDQRENYAAAARYAHGEALDVCCYQGGFALHLARACSRVTGVDVSRAALEVAERNLTANSGLTAQVDWVEADAFDLLRDWSESGAAYDTIVLDPPAFAKSKRAVEGALRGYKELNLRALKMLRPGGVLVTCSCSHHVSGADFQAIVAAAAGDAGRRVRLLERRGAAADHPVVLTIPETEYLKCLVCQVD